MYNGKYLNLPNLDIYSNSSRSIDPSAAPDKNMIKQSEEAISKSYDLTYHEFIEYLQKYLMPGNLETLCNAPPQQSVMLYS